MSKVERKFECLGWFFCVLGRVSRILGCLKERYGEVFCFEGSENRWGLSVRKARVWDWPGLVCCFLGFFIVSTVGV